MKMLAATLLLCAACAPPAGAQKAAAASALKVRVRGGRTLVVTDRGRPHALRVGDEVGAARLEEASVIFVSRAGGFTYLLLDVCGPSKLKSDDRQCGAGTECDLLWLKLDDGWETAGKDSARYESCWRSITSDEGYRVAGRTLHMKFSDFREQLEYTLTYDAERPEQGLRREKSPLPDN